MVAAVAMIAAVSCNKEFSNDNLFGGDVITFRASVDGADTKAILNGKKSSWEADDKITIHNGENAFEFAATGAGESVNFTYDNTKKDFSGEKFMAIYPAGDFTADVENKIVTALIPTEQGAKHGTYKTNNTLAIAFTENSSLEFKNAAALLKFTVARDDVKSIIFYGNNEAPITGTVHVTLDDDNSINSVVAENTYVKCWADEGTEHNYCFVQGETYYVAVAPADFTTGISVDFWINDGSFDGVEHKKVMSTTKHVELRANTILDLGELSYDPNKVDASVYGVVGSFQAPTTWDVANPVAMEYVSDGWIVAKNVELYKTDEFKFVKDKSWTVSYGTSNVTVLEEDTEVAVVTANSQNMMVSKNGKYDLYLNPNANKVKVQCVEEYKDLMVTITVDNKANWSPLYITLKYGNAVIADNATVTNNKYQISAEYIGKTLTCTLSNGTKTSDVMNVSITKTGATVTLEETIIKLKVQLNTDNAKKWWGDTMKIHAWETGTSFDTSWPGNTMTSEGNYTWSIIVPSELVGKTIKYLVHNGNGWQSKDATVTISADGNTVTGSSIGIN